MYSNIENLGITKKDYLPLTPIS